MTNEQRRAFFKELCLRDLGPPNYAIRVHDIITLARELTIEPAAISYGDSTEYLGFSENGYELLHTMLPNPRCRHCKTLVSTDDFAIGSTYWWPRWVPYHNNCIDIGQRQEAHACQSIDRDCNDCKHFTRTSRADRTGTSTGHCQKFNQITTAQARQSSNLPCFEHRRTAP